MRRGGGWRPGFPSDPPSPKKENKVERKGKNIEKNPMKCKGSKDPLKKKRI